MAKSEAHRLVEESLSIEFREAFNMLVLEYQDASERHTSDHSRRVNYKILADLVRTGWKKP